ncbi:MAG TPA: DNA polymerase III subunit delta [Gemmataceae bacterium]|nr:DNA polymerase III subunit delta [Gemmataceae bacterium]
MDCQTFLDRPERHKQKQIYVVHGDESFLKRQVLVSLRQLILGTGDDAFGLSTIAGDKADFAAVHDELQTLPFLGSDSRRLVVIEDADPFVTKYRTALEKYATEPAAGVLVLDVKSWPATTRLAKLVPADATIVCKAPPPYKLADWCVRWATARHGKKLAQDAARLLVDLIGSEMGQLDQELDKLAVYVGSALAITASDVDKLVGSSRAENTWKIFDAIGAGQTGAALTILDRLFEQGEEPLRTLGAFSSQLRRLVTAARLNEQGQPLGQALERAGIPPFAVRGCEHQLRHLGRQRVNQLYDWLLEVDLGLKGSSQLPARTLLERLVAQLARKPGMPISS